MSTPQKIEKCRFIANIGKYRQYVALSVDDFGIDICKNLGYNIPDDVSETKKTARGVRSGGIVLVRKGASPTAVFISAPKIACTDGQFSCASTQHARRNRQMYISKIKIHNTIQ